MDILRDLRYAVRSLRRSPGFAAVAVASIALGIGANTAIFSVVNGVLLRSMPYKDPEQLHVVRERIGSLAHLFPSAAANLRHYLEWRERCEAFDGLAAGYVSTMNLTGGGDPERVSTMRVSGNFFEVLGAAPAAGRFFDATEEQIGRDRVVVMTNGFWRRRFGANPQLLGRTITLDGGAYTVAGILPENFHLPRSEHLGAVTRYGSGIELFKPLGVDPAKESPMGEHDWVVIGRLKRGVSPEQATAQLNAIQKSLTERYAKELDLTAMLIPFREHVVGSFRRGLWVLMAAVFAVLLIVCTNIANLLLVRVVGRARETAIRTAIGAGSWQIVRLMLSEAVVICAVGGALGFIVAAWSIDLFVSAAPTSLPRVAEVSLDWNVLAFATGMSVFAALVFAAFPAWQALRSDPQDALRAGSHTTSGALRGRRTRDLLVTCEVGLSALLLVIAGLLTASLIRIINVDKGFRAENALTVEVELNKQLPSEQRGQSIESIISRVGTLPGVRSVAASTVLPLEGTAHVNFVRREGDTRTPFELPMANYRFVSPGYLDALGMELKRGRWLSEEDRTRNAVVITENVARVVWPGEDPMGKRLDGGGLIGGWSEVVGIVADTRAVKLDRDPVLMIYVPVWKRNPSSFALIVRTDRDAAAIAPAVRSEVLAVNPDSVVARMRTLERVMSDSLSARRFQLLLIGVFAAAALVLAALGIYGVVSYSVARRKAEIGIRMALGAAVGDVHLLVLRQGLRPVLLGLILGLTAAAASGKVVSALLFGVTATDPLTYAVVLGVLATAAVVACYVPARRATRCDPAAALRYE